MSAPKKGKDLSALKARLAKKAAAAEGGGAPDVPAPGEVKAAVPAPGEVTKPTIDVPAPGQVKRPAMDIPAPGEVIKPVDIPAPGEVRQPEPAPAEAEKKGDIASDPMSGGVAFDPNAGIIDDVGVELKPKGSGGLVAFVGVIGIVVGAGLGWMAHRATDSNSRVKSARAKAETIQAKVEEIEQTRARIALKIGEAKDALEAQDGAAAVAALTELEPTYVELADLFGWQMASMHPDVIKSIFSLAEANNSLQLDVGILKGWIGANEAILSGRAKGPSSFVVIASPQGGSILAEYVSAICDEIPEELPEDFDPNSLAKCEGDAILTAKGYMVRTEIGGPTSMVPANQGFFLNPAGPIYTYAIGANPEANAKAYFDIRMGKLSDTMDQMVKMKDDALTGIGNYTDDPKVNGE